MTREEHDIQPEDTIPPGDPNEAASETPGGLVLHSGQQLPTTPNLRRQLKLGLDAVLSGPRPEVQSPEDTYAIQRRLAAIGEQAKDYGRAFTAFEREDLRPAMAEILADAVGEQDGIPNGALVVPDADGTNIKIAPDTANSYDIDTDMIFNAVAQGVMETSRDALAEMFRREYAGDGATAQMILASVLALGMRQAVALGKFEPQVSKVRAYAVEVARGEGGDITAAILKGSIKKTVIDRGVKVTRTAAKKEK
jgi:hypothetical protein